MWLCRSRRSAVGRTLVLMKMPDGVRGTAGDA